MPASSVLCSPLVELAGEGVSATERAHRYPLPVAGLLEGFVGACLRGRDPKATPLASLYADLYRLPALRVPVGPKSSSRRLRDGDRQ